MAILKPSPSAPKRWLSGTKASSKLICRVGWLFQPILASLRPKPMPSVRASTAKAQMPWAPDCTPSALAKRAMTTSTSVSPAPEMNALVPLSR